MAEDTTLAQAIMDAFGKQVYTRSTSGILFPDRKKLAGIVFSDPEALEQLNGLVHPAVIASFDAWAARMEAGTPYVIKESALLFESDAWKHTEQNIAVTAPEEERIRRVMARDGVSKEKVLQRMAHQFPEEEKVRLADMIIRNDNQELVIPQVLAIHRLLQHTSTDLIL